MSVAGDRAHVVLLVDGPELVHVVPAIVEHEGIEVQAVLLEEQLVERVARHPESCDDVTQWGVSPRRYRRGSATTHSQLPGGIQLGDLPQYVHHDPRRRYG